jgi:general secretion pathway protein G
MRKHRLPESARGFTLVELMVVIVILGGLIALVGPRVFTALTRSANSTAEAQMASIADAIKMYFADNKKLPPGLDALVQDDPKRGGRYLDSSSVPKDPWGNPYDYKQTGRDKFQIRSMGEDSQEGTQDDLVWPKEGEE